MFPLKRFMQPMLINPDSTFLLRLQPLVILDCGCSKEGTEVSAEKALETAKGSKKNEISFPIKARAGRLFTRKGEENAWDEEEG